MKKNIKYGIVAFASLIVVACGVSGGPSLLSKSAVTGPLASLGLSTGSLSFNSLTYAYTVTVAHGTGNIVFTPTVSSAYPGATLTVNGSSTPSGSPTSAQSLSDGYNPVTIIVTSASGTILQTYVINVIQNGPPGFGTVAPIANGYPYGTVTLGGHFLYGLTNSDGANSQGTVFKIKTDGTGYQDLHDFGGAGDGTNALGNLLLSADGTKLYGMTEDAGASGHGTIFSIHTDGTAYATLHDFDGTNGSQPGGNSLIISGITLYGMTTQGGTSGSGAIFSMQTDGSNFNLLHSFTTLEGGQPSGDLTLIGNKLYGVTANAGDTSAGGGAGDGTIFSMSTDGSGFQVLHTFEDVDGGHSRSQLLQIGSTLFGLADAYGSSSNGTIYKIGTDGAGFTVIHNFAGGAADGAGSDGSLVASADQTTLYGWAEGGGASGDGVLFSLPANATTATPVTLVHTFTGGASDGSFPYEGAPILVGSTLYGMTQLGGVGDSGFIFSYGF